MEIKGRFKGSRWFIEGDISSFFDKINHQVLINILRRRIEDEKFIRLIWKFLKAGYLEDWKFHNTYSGTPQGGIVSPILANIYLNEFDRYMNKYQEEFNKGNTRGRGKEYNNTLYLIKKVKNQLKDENLTDEQKKNYIREYKGKIKLLRELPTFDPMDENYKRLVYVRYADDFIIGIIGSKQDALKVKADIGKFLTDKLSLELSEEKTLITSGKDKVKFLGYEMTVGWNSRIYEDKFGIKRRTANGHIRLFVPKETWVDKVKNLGALKIDNNGKWKILHRGLQPLDDLEILSIYNAEIRGLYNYYMLANNVSVLSKFHYIMSFSMYKTFASKYRTSVNKILNKCKVNGVFTINYRTKKGVKASTLYDQGFRQNLNNVQKDLAVDYVANTWAFKGKSSIISRLVAETCEWCGNSGLPLEMHHVRKLKDLKGKNNWERKMIERRRKTMALCINCHDDLHAGRLD